MKIYPRFGGQSKFSLPHSMAYFQLAGYYPRLHAANAVLVMNHEGAHQALAETSIRRKPLQGGVIFTLSDSATRSTRTTPQVQRPNSDVAG
jgi:hypothetical protein